MQIAVVTLFPELVAATGEFGVVGRALGGGLVSLSCWNPRDYTEDRHRTVDDKPFGGGPGMLMKTAPLQCAIGAARQALDQRQQQQQQQQRERRVIYLSPQGRQLDQGGVEELAELDLVLVCGRYQGIDERVLISEIDQEWSIGDYVISGGELAAMVLIDAVARLQPGVLGAEDSAGQDSFSDGLLHCPQYTRPREVAGLGVPATLLGGDHEQIRRWRLKQSLGATWRKRPDLLAGKKLNTEQQMLLQEFIKEFEATRVNRPDEHSGAER